MSNLNDFVIENGALKKYLGSGGVVTVPDAITELSDNVFNNMLNTSNAGFQYIKTVILPDSLRKIGDMVFWNCLYMEQICIPDGVESIGEDCFNSCYNLKKIHLPESVRTIGKNAFNCCENLAEFSAPGVVVSGLPGAKIKELAVRSFINEYGNYTKPEVVASYHKYLFSQKKKYLPVVFAEDRVDILRIFGENKKITAENLNDIFIAPAIKADAKQCVAYLLDMANKLNLSTNADIPSGKSLENDSCSVSTAKKIWGFSELKDGTLLLTSYKGTDKAIIIPGCIGDKVVTGLDKSLFSPLKERTTAAQKEILNAIESVFLPNSITHMEDGVFSNCENLSEVVLSDSIKSIGEFTFTNCTKLSKVILPKNLTSIGNYAFSGCSNLKDLNLPLSITKIGNSAFSNCSLLQLGELSPDVEIEGSAFQGCVAMADELGFVIVKNILYSYHGKEKHVIIPQGVHKMIGIVFSNAKQICEISIPATVTEIGKFVFHKCKKICIRGSVGSYAQDYAKENNIPFAAE